MIASLSLCTLGAASAAANCGSPACQDRFWRCTSAVCAAAPLRWRFSLVCLNKLSLSQKLESTTKSARTAASIASSAGQAKRINRRGLAPKNAQRSTSTLPCMRQCRGQPSCCCSPSPPAVSPPKRGARPTRATMAKGRQTSSCSCGVLYSLRVVRVGIACHVHVASMAPRATSSTR